MSTSISHHSQNGAAPASRSWKHLRIDRRSAGHCRVTFDHPPDNAVTAGTVGELAELVGLIEQDPDLKVVVFDSAIGEFYLTGGGLGRTDAAMTEPDNDPDGTTAWMDLLVRLSRAPVVSVAAVRGRVRGAGHQFVLACDLKFASRENTLLGPFDDGVYAARGDDSTTARLARLVGRGRALEILLCAGDLDGPLAEHYGYVNRAIADDRLDGEVAAMAAGVERFDRTAIARAKTSVDRGTLRGG